MSSMILREARRRTWAESATLTLSRPRATAAISLSESGWPFNSITERLNIQTVFAICYDVAECPCVQREEKGQAGPVRPGLILGAIQRQKPVGFTSRTRAWNSPLCFASRSRFYEHRLPS